jgi:Cd2+/Zn2+-exporting ATPase
MYLSEKKRAARTQKMVLARIAGTFLGGAFILNAYIFDAISPDTPEIGSISAFLGAVLLSAPIIWGAVKDLIEGHLHMTELVALAIIACFALQDYKTAGVVAFFMLMAELIQHRTALGARASIEQLVKLTPTTARLIKEGGTEEEVESTRLTPGARIRIRPGDAIAADGKIISGTSSINEASITGESLPADKGPDDLVFAGTTNLTGALEVEVSKAGPDTTLGRVQNLILDAEKTKTPVMRIIDRHAQWYTPVVIMLAGFFLFVTRDIGVAVTALVVTCPCAIILATPTAMVAALSSAARLGILVKNVSDLEAAGRMNAVIFDKTGTLTTGQLAVSRLAPTENTEGAELLRLAASVERHSNHPIAKALVSIAQEAKIPLSEPETVQETAGKGVEGHVDGQRVLVGRKEWLQARETDLSLVESNPKLVPPEGLSILYVSRDHTCIGWIGLEDKARPDAREAAADLRQLGFKRLTMLTGDRWSVAHKVASELGCSEVEAECLPERKLEIVESMKQKGYKVVVVGDGVNDAPALAAGDMGIAMGAAGSDIAINSATIALMSSDLEKLPFLVRLSRKSTRVVYQNLIFGVLFVVGGLSLAFMGILTPIWAAIFHNVGSFIVIFNSARLVRYGEELTPFAHSKSA